MSDICDNQERKTEALRQQTCSSATLHTTHPTWNDLEESPVFYINKFNDVGYSKQVRCLALTEHAACENPS